ncbi:AraC family transcriptional regulator [Saccharothrix longispora]|uniref:helix-turn-helix transcriptional regulator n=1 Tax=Saccharothrix longispora TaxID=33920 RepID=UPI0028FD2C57|nr:AraC family transcriptional regulator [Saccharothrix longispora]MDU0294833.1 AraC family transcriptional regulator [Saccharothrix longispora]
MFEPCLEAGMRPSVRQAIRYMNSRFHEPIHMDDIASSVFVSRFHFCRIFANATGVTPGKYLAAVRMFEAKRLLLTTSQSVADIVCSVGYSSVGTFTTRFTQAVGMTPSQYRDPRVRDLHVSISPDFFHLPTHHAMKRAGLTTSPRVAPKSGTGTVMVQLPTVASSTTVLVGVFAERIPQRPPVAFAYARRIDDRRAVISGVPAGNWYVSAVAEGVVDDERSGLAVATAKPVAVHSDRVEHVYVRLERVTHEHAPFAFSFAQASAADAYEPRMLGSAT